MHDFLALIEIAVDVFDFHRGVVHQDAHRQRQPAQSHDVDGLVQETEHDDRRQNRQRDGNGDNHRAPPTAQEQQNHQSRKAGGDHRLANDAVDGSAHEDRLVG